MQLNNHTMTLTIVRQNNKVMHSVQLISFQPDAILFYIESLSLRHVLNDLHSYILNNAANVSLSLTVNNLPTTCYKTE